MLSKRRKGRQLSPSATRPWAPCSSDVPLGSGGHSARDATRTKRRPTVGFAPFLNTEESDPHMSHLVIVLWPRFPSSICF